MFECQGCQVSFDGLPHEVVVEERGVQYRTTFIECGKAVGEKESRGREIAKALLLCDSCAAKAPPPVLVEDSKVVESTAEVPKGWAKDQELKRRREAARNRSRDPYSNMRGSLDSFGNPE